jgi:hypothetical protein
MKQERRRREDDLFGGGRDWRHQHRLAPSRRMLIVAVAMIVASMVLTMAIAVMMVSG